MNFPQVYVTILQFGIGLGSILVLIWPWIRQSNRGAEIENPDDSTEMKKQNIIDALSDLEFEHETGKINDQDYERLRSVYVRKALDTFDESELEQLTSPEDSSAQQGSDDLESAIRQARDDLN